MKLRKGKKQTTDVIGTKSRQSHDSLIAAILLVAAGLFLPMNAAVAQTAPSAPSLLFVKGTAPSGTLYAYLSFGNIRASYSFVSGSGNGSSDPCASNAGWLPNGTYSNISHLYKNWGNAVVQGWVWQLPNKQCSSGTTRTELFIHSSGIEGTAWLPQNYNSNGCVKLNQTDRTFLHNQYSGSYNNTQGSLTVY